jgi:siroheme synthase (precorrin-2 oxidase/ferrochelatase)
MTAFTYKGYGRIYTDPEYIQDVEKIIQELDEFEYQNYFPESLVGFWDDYPIVVCVGNFALDEEKFKQICKERNIPVFVFNAYDNECPRGYVKTLNREEIKQLSYGELK